MTENEAKTRLGEMRERYREMQNLERSITVPKGPLFYPFFFVESK